MSRWADKTRVRRILDGDEAEGARLVADYYPELRRFLHHLTGHEEEAKDLTQQAFLEAWKSLAGFRGDSSLKTWLHRIGYHQYTRWLRSRRDCLSLDELPPEALPLAVTGMEARWEGIFVRNALARLSPEHREVVLLRYGQEFTVREIARILNLPSGTVKTRLFAARKRLREMLLETRSDPAEVPSNEVQMAPFHE